MKAGNVYSTFAIMKLQNGNEINYLAEGCGRKWKKSNNHQYSNASPATAPKRWWAPVLQ